MFAQCSDCPLNAPTKPIRSGGHERTCNSNKRVLRSAWERIPGAATVTTSNSSPHPARRPPLDQILRRVSRNRRRPDDPFLLRRKTRRMPNGEMNLGQKRKRFQTAKPKWKTPQGWTTTRNVKSARNVWRVTWGHPKSARRRSSAWIRKEATITNILFVIGTGMIRRRRRLRNGDSHPSILRVFSHMITRLYVGAMFLQHIPGWYHDMEVRPFGDE